MAEYLKNNSPQALLQAKLDGTDDAPKTGLEAIADEAIDPTSLKAAKAPGTGLVVDKTA
jgi:hypothetical protein